MGKEPNPGEERQALRQVCLRFRNPGNPADQGISEAAREVGVSVTTMRRWLSGRARIPRLTVPWLESVARSIAREKARERR